MGCSKVDLGDGTAAIVCTRGRGRSSPPCACGARSKYLCDGPKPGTRSGTCDKALCTLHATRTGPDSHLCHECRGAGPKLLDPAVEVDALIAEQASLFPGRR